MYDESAGVPSLLLRAALPAGGTCHGKPCWKLAGSTGIRYGDRDGTPNGVTKATLKSGIGGKASVKVKAKGLNLAMPALSLDQDTHVTVQLKNSQGVCWGSSYPAPAIRNDSAQFKDKL